VFAGQLPKEGDTDEFLLFVESYSFYKRYWRGFSRAGENPKAE
jgi:hypothetical protein